MRNAARQSNLERTGGLLHAVIMYIFSQRLSQPSSSTQAYTVMRTSWSRKEASCSVRFISLHVFNTILFPSTYSRFTKTEVSAVYTSISIKKKKNIDGGIRCGSLRHLDDFALQALAPFWEKAFMSHSPRCTVL